MEKNKKIDVKSLFVDIFLIAMLSVLFIGVSKPLAVAFLIVGLVILLGIKFDIPKYPLFIFSFSLILRVIIVFIIKTPPVSDFQVLYNASKSLLENDLSFLDGAYFSMWSYQIGFVFVQSLLLRIVNSIVFLKIMNCVVSSLTVVLIYLIARELTDEKGAKIASLIYTLLPFTVTYVTILTNQYLSSLLIYLALYILIAKKIPVKSNLKYMMVGALLALANIIRPESIIPLVSIVLFLVLTFTKKNIKNNILKILTTMGTYFCILFLISTLFSISGLAPNGLKNNDPYWKFVLGFNHETGGSYSNEDTINIGNTEKEIELIKERILVSPLKLLNLFSKKIKTFWLDTTSGWTFIGVYNEKSSIFSHLISVSDSLNIMEAINNYMMYIFYILVFIGVRKYISKNNYNKNVLLIIIQVFVTFGVYLLIEVQSRYAYHIQISIAILASLGINEIIKYINNKSVNRKSKF